MFSYSLKRLQEHRKQCAKYGFSINTMAYKNGHDRGVSHFCTASRGFRLGERGRNYTGVCPIELETRFLSGYQRGLDAALSKNGHQLHRLEHQFHSKDHEHNSKKDSEQEKHDLQRLEEKIRKLHYERDDLFHLLEDTLHRLDKSPRH